MVMHGRGDEGETCEWSVFPVVLHSTSEHGVSSITTADAHISAASNRINWKLCQFKWHCTFRWKINSGFFACAITFQTCCTNDWMLRTHKISLACHKCGYFLAKWFFIAEIHGAMQINWEFMSMPPELQQNFHLPQHMREVSLMYTYFSYSATYCDKVWTPLYTFSIIRFHFLLCKISNTHVKFLSQCCAKMKIIHSSG